MFYENVKSLCYEHRTNITQLCRDLGMSTSMPTQWKNGAVPKSDTVKKIADFFGVSADYLLADKPAQSNSMGSISHSAVVQGGDGNVVSVSTGGLDQTEAELLRVFRALDLKGRTAVLSCAYDQEDKQQK